MVCQHHFKCMYCLCLHITTAKLGMVMQEELIGQEKDKAGDEAKRAKLHQQWLEKQDEQELAKLMDGVRNGFRRKRAGDLLLDDVRALTHRLLLCCPAFVDSSFL